MFVFTTSIAEKPVTVRDRENLSMLSMLNAINPPGGNELFKRRKKIDRIRIEGEYKINDWCRKSLPFQHR